MNDTDRPRIDPSLLMPVLLACCVPTLLAYNRPPSPVALNELTAVVLWGGVAAMTYRVVDSSRKFFLQIGALTGAIGLVAMSAIGSWGLGNLPMSMALPAFGLLMCAVLMVACGASAARVSSGPMAFAALALGLLLAGLASSGVAFVQVFAPAWTDIDWISPSNNVGVATGNLRQPNQLSSVLIWGLVAAVALHELRWLSRLTLWVVALPIVWAIELTSSRTGALNLIILFGWALLDRRLSRATRWLLASLPLLYGVIYGGMAWMNSTGLAQHIAVAGRARVLEKIGVGDVNSRLVLWQNTIEILIKEPWTGVGFGEFGISWFLSPLSTRPRDIFDNTHNLILQLTVELGVPLALLVIGLITIALVQGVARAKSASGDAGMAARGSLVMITTIGLHSMLEFPLWYAFFLLPTALAWGFLLGTPGTNETQAILDNTQGSSSGPTGNNWGLFAGLLMSLMGAWSIYQFQQIQQIFSKPQSPAYMKALLENGQNNKLYANYADYAIIMAHTGIPDISDSTIDLALSRALHKNIDHKMVIFLANRIAAQGHIDQARWLAQRLRESPNAATDSFFAPCKDPTNISFQCQWPVAEHNWREYANLVKPGRLNSAK